MSTISPDDKIAISSLYVKLVEEGCTTPFAKAMELALMDKAVEFLKQMADNSDKLHKILNMMDSRILGIQERMAGMEEAIVSQLPSLESRE